MMAFTTSTPEENKRQTAPSPFYRRRAGRYNVVSVSTAPRMGRLAPPKNLR